MTMVWLNLEYFRFFSGNTTNADGTVQFVAGKTSFSDAVDGVIKIFTIAVSSFSALYIFAYSYSFLISTVLTNYRAIPTGNNCGCRSA